MSLAVTGRGALHLVEHNLLVYRRTWRGSIVGTILMPVAFLAAMGLGLGGLVDRHAGGVQGLSYVAFIAPGLLAANAMQSAGVLATYPIMGKIRWEHTYEAVLATPEGVFEILLGELAWIALRMLQGAVIFAIVMVLFGAARSPWLLAAIPVAVLTGLSFAAPISALSGIVRNDTPFSVLQRFVILPLFLFGGAFFPLSHLPGLLQVVAWALPLAHGVALTRALSVGTAAWGPALLHLAVLLAYFLAGAVASYVVLRRALRP
ncbi:MAG: ABC transporter permease [Candidatus Dormibacteraceae bacterium]